MPPPLSRPDVAEFARAFPFHLVITPQLTIAGIGSGLARLDPSLARGAAFEKHFALQAPAAPLSWGLLAASPEAECCLIHRATLLELRGRMVIPDDGGALIFLGSCWLDDAEQLADFGVAIDTIAGPSPTPKVPPALTACPTITDPEELAARCRRLERCLGLHHAWSSCLAESHDADSALIRLVEAIPTALGWASAALWSRNADGEADCQRTYPATTPPPGGILKLVDRAFRNGAPVWSANSCDGAGGFAIPVHAEQGTIAVLSGLSTGSEPEDHELSRQLYLLAGQLSRFLARQQQRERLTRLTSELSAIFQLSADGFVAFNSEGKLSYLNPAFARMSGLERDDLRGLSEPEFEQRLSALLDPDRVAEKASNGDPVIHFVQPRNTVLQRSRRDARDIEGRLVGRLLSFRDITLETELLRANSEFLSNAAHELRTPMASIHGFVELLLKREFPPDKLRNVLETVHSQSTRLSEIVDELLEVARFDARAARDLVRRPQPLSPIIRATVNELLIRDDPRRVSLALPDDAESPWADVDRARLTQALTNVLSNAYKYSPEGGTIDLRLLEQTRGEQAWVGIAVRDRGIGMTPEEKQHLFDRFFRAHPSGKIPGTGLGMSMIKKIVDAHGGMVEVESAPGAGTEVTLWLAAVPRGEELAAD